LNLRGTEEGVDEPDCVAAHGTTIHGIAVLPTATTITAMPATTTTVFG